MVHMEDMKMGMEDQKKYMSEWINEKRALNRLVMTGTTIYQASFSQYFILQSSAGGG